MTIRFEISLDLPDVQLLETAVDRQGNTLIRVVSTKVGTSCRHCGCAIQKPYGHDREIVLRHFSIFGRDTFIHIRPKRYQCQDCDGHPVTTQSLDWYEQRSPHTKAYEAHIMWQLVNNTIADVSRKERLGYGAIEGIIDRYVGKGVDWSSFKRLGQIGLDEIALKKGHKDFVTVVTSRSKDGAIRILAVLKDRKKATIKEFFLSIPKRLRKTIQTVCTDLYEGFINGAKEVLGRKIKIVADRFHVAKLYRKGLDVLRKNELRRLKKELSKDAYQQLRGVMWLLRKRSDQLTVEDQAKLNILFGYSPALEMAYIACTLLTRIFDEPLSVAEAKMKLRAWQDLVNRVEDRLF